MFSEKDEKKWQEIESWGLKLWEEFKKKIRKTDCHFYPVFLFQNLTNEIHIFKKLTLTLREFLIVGGLSSIVFFAVEVEKAIRRSSYS